MVLRLSETKGFHLWLCCTYKMTQHYVVIQFYQFFGSSHFFKRNDQNRVLSKIYTRPVVWYVTQYFYVLVMRSINWCLNLEGSKSDPKACSIPPRKTLSSLKRDSSSLPGSSLLTKKPKLITTFTPLGRPSEADKRGSPTTQVYLYEELAAEGEQLHSSSKLILTTHHSDIV